MYLVSDGNFGESVQFAVDKDYPDSRQRPPVFQVTRDHLFRFSAALKSRVKCMLKEA